MSEKEAKRFSFLLSDEEKANWKQYMKEHDISTFSRFIRESAEFYIEKSPAIDFSKDLSKKMHDLEQPLTNIKAICEILLKKRKNEIKLEDLLYIKDILDQAEILQERMTNISYSNSNEVKNTSVLIVEDDPLTIKILSSIIEENDLSYVKATNGKEALRSLERVHPKLILLDIMLPDLTGYEICKFVKSDPELKDILVFYITAVAESEVKQKVKETGAEGYVLKPFEMDEIKQLFSLIE